MPRDPLGLLVWLVVFLVVVFILLKVIDALV